MAQLNKRRRERLIISAAILLLVLLGAVVVALDWEQGREVLLDQADWRLVLVALLLTTISYVCLSYSFAAISKTLASS